MLRQSAVTEGRRQIRVVFVGRTDDSLRSLLEDVVEVEWVVAELLERAFF